MKIIDSDQSPVVSTDDRGLAYGDGLFETLRVIAGTVPMLAAHMARLARGCQVFGIALDISVVESALLEYAHRHRHKDWIKLIVTRGSGARGYAVVDASEPTLILSSGRLSAHNESRWRLRLCKTPLPIQPELAGLKHLNRLPQVLARNEWQDDHYDEGLMCDQDGAPVCGIMTNVFVVRDSEISTPRLNVSGVAGVMREWVLSTVPVSVRRLTLDDVLLADEVFLTNALRGVISVSQLQGAVMPHSAPVASALRGQLAALGIVR